jgi:hypothetical protein
LNEQLIINNKNTIKMWGFECPSFKEFREEDIVCKSIKFHLADEM